jgi:hypothetical protein
MSSCRRLPSAAIEAEAEAAVGVGEAEVGGAEGVGAGTAARERGQSGACAWRGRRRRRTTTRHKRYFEIARAYSAVSRTAVYFGWGCLRLPCTLPVPPHRPPSGTDCSRRPMPHQSASAQSGIGHRSGTQRIPGRLWSQQSGAQSAKANFKTNIFFNFIPDSYRYSHQSPLTRTTHETHHAHTKHVPNTHTLAHTARSHTHATPVRTHTRNQPKLHTTERQLNGTTRLTR